MSFIDKLCAVQAGLKSPKDQKAQKYRYRNIEAVNEAVKPLAADQGCAVIYRDRLESIDGHLVCVSECVLTDGTDSASSEAFAIVNTSPKGMSVEQACGAASSYARKYAACGLFAIDDSRDDPDRRNAKPNPMSRLGEVMRTKKAQGVPTGEMWAEIEMATGKTKETIGPADVDAAVKAVRNMGTRAGAAGEARQGQDRSTEESAMCTDDQGEGIGDAPALFEEDQVF